MIKNRDEKEFDLVKQFEKNERRIPRLTIQDEDIRKRFKPLEETDPIFPGECSSDPIENDFECREVEREARREAKLVKRKTLHLVLFSVRYCTTCGTTIARTSESSTAWGKVRRCAECIKHTRRSTRDRKFCSICGQDFASEFSEATDWRTKAVCSACANLNRKKLEVLDSLL